MWKLKEDQPSFEMVDGPMAGRAFVHGQDYAEVPISEAYRFDQQGEIAGQSAPEADPKQARKGRKDAEEVTNA